MKARTKKSLKHKYYFSIGAEHYEYLNKEFHLFVWGDIYTEKESSYYKVWFTSKVEMLNKKFHCANFLYAKLNNGICTNIN
jgi:hypothetical protein